MRNTLRREVHDTTICKTVTRVNASPRKRSGSLYSHHPERTTDVNLANVTLGVKLSVSVIIAIATTVLLSTTRRLDRRLWSENWARAHDYGEWPGSDVYQKVECTPSYVPDSTRGLGVHHQDGHNIL